MEAGTEYITDSQHDEKETKRDFLRYISDAMYSENDIKLTDALMKIHCEMKRYNDRVERHDRLARISSQKQIEIEAEAEKLLKELKEEKKK